MFGVLVVSKPNGVADGVVRHTAIANIESKVTVWTRVTDGKQGRSNAWSQTDIASVVIADQQLVGSVTSVPVTSGDINDFNQSGVPNVLLQKLTNAHGRGEFDIETDADIQNLVENLFDIASTDADQLRQYFRDNRGRKSNQKVVEHSTIQHSTTSVVADREAMPVASTPHLFVPAWDKYKHHIEREFAGGVNELALCEFAIKNKMNILASGDAGTGKTELGYWYASKTGKNIAVVQSTGSTDISSMAGAYYPHPSTGQLTWDDGWLTSVVRHGGVVVIDEVSMLPRNIGAFLHSLLDDRRCLILDSKFGEKVVEAHPDLLIIAGMNPNYRGTHQLNEAFRDRFDIKLTYGYDKKIESKIIKSASLRDLANRMRAQASLNVNYASSDVAFETPISPRLLKAFEKIAVGLGFEFASEVFVNNFSDEEQPAVRTLLEGLSFNIQEDLNLTKANIVTDAGDDDFALNA